MRYLKNCLLFGMIISVFSCTKNKELIACEYEQLHASQWIDSRIEQLSLAAIVNTTTAQLKGTIRGLSGQGNSEHKDLLFGVVVAIKPSNQEEFDDGTISANDGTYIQHLEPGTYDLSLRYLGFSELSLSGLHVDAGEVLILDVLLGEGNGKHSFKIAGNERFEIAPKK